MTLLGKWRDISTIFRRNNKFRAFLYFVVDGAQRIREVFNSRGQSKPASQSSLEGRKEQKKEKKKEGEKRKRSSRDFPAKITKRNFTIRRKMFHLQTTTTHLLVSLYCGYFDALFFLHFVINHPAKSFSILFLGKTRVTRIILYRASRLLFFIFPFHFPFPSA